MEDKIIGFGKGIRRTPSVGYDGELAECVNLVVKNGEIVNAPRMERMERTVDGTLRYMHKTTDGQEHYIVEKERTLSADSETLLSGEGVRGVKSIGNMLVVNSAQSGVNSYLWNGTKYISQTDKLKMLDVRFGLQSTLEYNPVDSKDGQVWIKNPAKSGGSISDFESTPFIIQNVMMGHEDVKKGFKTYPLGKSMILHRGKYFRIGFDKSNDPYLKDWQYEVIALDKDQKQIADFHEKTSADRVSVVQIPDTCTMLGLVIYSDMTLYDTIYAYKQKADIGQFLELEKDVEDDRLIVQGSINSFVTRHSLNAGKFIFPFFVRCAIKLKTGEHVLASAPVLMVPNSGEAPLVSFSGISDLDKNTFWGGPYNAYVSAYASTLHFQVLDAATLAALQSSEMVSSLVIAVSAPMRQLKTDYTDEDIKNNLFIRNAPRQKNYTYAMTGKVQQPTTMGGTVMDGWLDVPTIEKFDSVVEEYSSTYYVVKEISIAEVTTAQTQVSISPSDMENLRALPQLAPSELLMDKYKPGNMEAYNGRIIMSDVTQELFEGYDFALMKGYVQGGQQFTSTATAVKYGERMTMVMRGTHDNTREALWYYIPNKDAIEVTINGTPLALRPHPFMNGAYYFGGFNSEKTVGTDTTAPEASHASMEHPNWVMTSKANNPLVTEDGYVMAGNGKVIATAINTKALSQGQYGQHPILAFTTEGLWAIEADGEGRCAVPKPLTRDIMIEGTTPLQTDSEVVFATKQGLKAIGAGRADLITKNLDGMSEDVSMLNNVVEGVSVTNLPRLSEMLDAGLKMLYDYSNRLVRVFTSDGTQLMLSQETSEWTRSTESMPGNIVAGYPYSIMQIGNALYRYSDTPGTERMKGVLLTRETAFGEPYTMKMLCDLRLMRKHEKNADGTKTAKVAVWASNDRKSWTMLRSLHGHSWKWYRFAIYTDMTDDDAVEGVVARIDKRRNGKLR